MEPLAPELHRYLDGLVPPRPPEMQAMETYAKEHNFPIVGPAAGYYCYQLARMIGARRIFELGSGYGYSTAWFARAVKENGGGTVFHVVWDDGLSQRARKHLGALGYDGIVQYRVSEAIKALRETEGPFDLIFNDIEKDGYPASLPVIKDKLRPGGLLITDNMLFHGTIFDPQNHTKSVEGIREFTKLVMNDPTLTASIVPIRDGLLVAQRATR